MSDSDDSQLSTLSTPPLLRELDATDSGEDEMLLSCKILRVVKRHQTGNSGKRYERYVVLHSGGVAVLPILDDGRVVLVRQYRIAVGGYIYEIPAGTQEPGEEPAMTARRELIEETGYHAQTLEPITSFYSSPGFLSERIHLFLATGLAPGASALEDGENLSVVLVKAAEVKRMIDSGEIDDGKTLIALLWFLSRS